MKKITLFANLLLLVSQAFAQSTAFTYQGRLDVEGVPASGTYDFYFGLYGTSSGSSLIGDPTLLTAVPVSNGLFTVLLDYGNQFTGADRWLGMSVRTNGVGQFYELTPRQAITATPYAVTAGSVSSSAQLNAGSLAFGTVGDARLSTNVALRSGGNAFTGSQTVNGPLNLNGPFRGWGDFRLYAFQGNGSNGTAFVQARDDSPTSTIDLVLRTKNASVLNDVVRLTSAGNVGVGTAAPAERLDVSGNVRATGDIVAAGNVRVTGDVVATGSIRSAGDVIGNGLVRLGSGTGTQLPRDRNLLVRQAKANFASPDFIVARTDKLLLVRRVGNGWTIKNLANPGEGTVAAFTGVTASGATVSDCVEFRADAPAGEKILFGGAGVVWLRGAFGTPFLGNLRVTTGNFDSGHYTEVSILGNFEAVGTIISTYDQ